MGGVTPFHGTIEVGSDGEPTSFSPGFMETEEMQRRGHEEFKARMGSGFPSVGVDSSYVGDDDDAYAEGDDEPAWGRETSTGWR